MDEFPPNSNVVKKKQNLQSENSSTSVPETEKKIEKIATGKVVRRKKTLGTRVHQMFSGESAAQVRNYVMYDVLVPAFKDMISDATSGAVDRILFGDDRAHRSRRRGRGDIFERSTGRIAYHRMSEPSRTRRDEPRQSIRPDRRSSAASTEILMSTRAEAQEALDVLFELLHKYEAVSVSDLNNLLGLDNQYTDDKWGWLALSGSDIRRVREGYVLILPEPQPLD